MSHATDLLTDAFSRVHGVVHGVVEGLDQEALAHRPAGTGNSIAWLVWHLTRVQDDHIADVAGTEQVWASGGWMGRFGRLFPVGDTGYGHSSEDVDQLGSVPAEVLTGYHDAVYRATVDYLAGLDDSEFDRIVDTRWDPPVTLGVRLISVADDDIQHAGQAAYVRGLLGALGQGVGE